LSDEDKLRRSAMLTLRSYGAGLNERLTFYKHCVPTALSSILALRQI
jgi:hypothetical protein